MPLKRILLVEDGPYDVELVLGALGENLWVNEVVVVRDGEEALDCLYRCGIFWIRLTGNPVVVLSDLKLPKVNGLEVLSQTKSDATVLGNYQSAFPGSLPWPKLTHNCEGRSHESSTYSFT